MSEFIMIVFCFRDDRLIVVLWGKFANDVDDAI